MDCSPVVDHLNGMCWSLEVSSGVCVLELICCAWIWKRNATPACRGLIPVLLTVAAVEFWEALIWGTVDVKPMGLQHPSLQRDCAPLSRHNWWPKLPLAGIVVAIALQPILLCNFSRLQQRSWRRKQLLLAAQLLSCLSLGSKLWVVVVRDACEGFCVFGSGPHGHLVWGLGDCWWRCSVQSWIYYCNFIVTPAVFHRQLWIVAAVLVWGLVFSRFVYPGGLEAMSFWCLTGVALHILMLWTPYWKWLYSEQSENAEETRTLVKLV